MTGTELQEASGAAQAGAATHAAPAGAATHAAPAAQQGGEHAAEWGPEAMLHHVTDSQVLDLGFFAIDLGTVSWLNYPPIHLGGLTIDLSVSRHVVFLFIASILTLITMWWASRAAQRLRTGEEAPGGILNTVEAFYLYLRDEVALGNIGRGGEAFVPYVVALFFFILYANLLGLVPYGATATANIMVTGALAFISLIVIEAAGYRALGPAGYLKTIVFVPDEVPWIMKPFMAAIMTPIELIGKLAKAFALAIRLFANMIAGHFVLLALLGLILTFGGLSVTGIVAVVGPLLLGLFVMFLELFVAFLHAYIFTVLTAVFIGLIRHAH